jgi:type I restriction enzyme, S subunit
MERVETKIPKLRFPEFNSTWERKKLNKISTVNPKNGALPDEFIYIDLESVEKGILVKEEKIFLKEAPSRAQRVLERNDILFQTVRPYQKNNFYFDRADNYIASTGYAQIRTKHNSRYLYQFLHTEKFVKKVLIRCTGTSYPAINSKDLANININFPSPPEQQKIASFLTAVDDKIQQLQRKKELLEQYKKGVMQKIFKQEIRFKDNDGKEFPEWGEKELGDCLNYLQPTNYIVKSTEYDNSFKTPVLTAGKTFVLGYTNEVDGIFKTNLPVIIFDDFTTATQFVNFTFKVKSSAIKILVAKENMNIKFIFETMQELKYEIGGHERHWISKFSKLEIQIPSITEQSVIANFMYAIDEKIYHCNTQIVKTQSFKKGLLQQMFV